MAITKQSIMNAGNSAFAGRKSTRENEGEEALANCGSSLVARRVSEALIARVCRLRRLGLFDLAFILL